jgi:Ca-activated chloride channel homolog
MKPRVPGAERGLTIVRDLRAWRLAAAALLCVLPSATPASGDEIPLSIRITSPLGRTGLTGPIRIVAQIQHGSGSSLEPVKFYVDEKLVGEDSDGPPYAVEWADANPYEARNIVVEVSDKDGNVARDEIRLDPLTITDVTRVSSVLLEATVQDKSGRYVGGLDAHDFVVEEDGVPQTTDLVQTEALEATYTLLIDSSQSMARRIDFVREAANRLAQHLRSQDRIIVAPFSRAIGAVTGPTDDRLTVGDAISAIQAKGGTAILDCLADIPHLLQGAEGRQAIVLFTDGYDEHSVETFQTAMEAVRSAHATVYVIAIGGSAGISLKGQRLLRRLATESGGKLFVPSREEELPRVNDLVAKDVEQRYLITYTPANQKIDGSWRSVTVRTTEAADLVRTRAGYFAPKPPPIRPTLEFTISTTNNDHPSLSASDLIVLEDGVEQTVDSFQEAVAPVSIVLALDTSGSMKPSVDAVKEAAQRFVEALQPQDKLAMVLFSDRPTFAHDLTKEREFSLAAIRQYAAAGGTALNDALYDSLMRLKKVDGRRVAVVMTDGRDENGPGTAPGSQHTLDDVLTRLKEVDATIFAIGLGPKVDRAPLERLATDSGGEAFFPQEVGSLARDYQRILETLRSRFALTFTSTNSTRDGAWRNLEIHSRVADVVIKSRNGYFAPTWDAPTKEPPPER